MNEAREVKISKYLAKHLRYQPEALGLVLEPGGWVAIDTLLDACRRHRFVVSRAELDWVVANNPKQRYSYDKTKTMIRANQGHSVEVDLMLEPLEPPPLLYHGTGEQSVAVILDSGLRKMRRQHVHLSLDIETAHTVGTRHGRPVILIVDAEAMHRDGHVFYRSENGVWLVDHVPPAYLQPYIGVSAS